MDDTTQSRHDAAAVAKGWVHPAFEVIAVDCEITAYAPDGDFPLL